MAKSFFQLQCEFHLTPMENALLTYEQKCELINYGKRIWRNEYRQKKLRSPISKEDCMEKIVFIVNDLPLSRLQKDALILRMQKYRAHEIAEILDYSNGHIERVLASIKNDVCIDDIADIGKAWHKKCTKNFEGEKFRA